MRVFVAGATGVLGIPVVRRLVAAGHEVVGLTRSFEKASLLESLGAEPSVADALDVPALRAAVLAARPAAVIDLLTGLAGRSLRRAADLAPTNALRREATRALVDAAASAAVLRFVAESMVFAYGYGDLGPRRLSEDEPASRRHPDRDVQAAVDAARSLEAQVLAATRDWRFEGVVVRLGLLYGARASDAAVAALRRRALPLPGGGAGAAAPVVSVDDAADAVVAALERGRPGAIYNVAEAEPAPLGEFFHAIARAAGAPRPRSLPMWMARRLAPYAATLFETRLAVSTDRARAELGWAPRHASFREALAGAAAP